MDPSELERRIDRDLRRLPAPTAPATFLPRVLLAARLLASRPWYQRAWRTWPGAWQAVSAAALLSVLVGVGVLLPTLQGEVMGAILRTAGGLWQGVAERTAGLRVGLGTLDVLWRALVQPVVAYLLALLVIMWAACAAFGVALSRVAFGEATHS